MNAWLCYVTAFVLEKVGFCVILLLFSFICGLTRSTLLSAMPCSAQNFRTLVAWGGSRHVRPVSDCSTGDWSAGYRAVCADVLICLRKRVNLWRSELHITAWRPVSVTQCYLLYGLHSDCGEANLQVATPACCITQYIDQCYHSISDSTWRDSTWFGWRRRVELRN